MFLEAVNEQYAWYRCKKMIHSKHIHTVVI